MEFIKNNQFKIAAIVVSLLIVCIVALFVFPKDGNNDNNGAKDDNEVNDVFYTVTFDSDGGDIVSNQSVLEGGKVIEPVVPLKEGYKFLGWYVGSRKFDFDNEVYQNITLVAKWEKIDGEETEDSENDEEKVEDNNSSSNNNKPITSDKVNVTGISLNKTSLTLNVGDSSTLVATVKPNNATNKNVSWTSSNKNVVTVSNGKIKAVGEGSAVITATAGGKKVTCNVTVNKVKDDKVAVAEITLNKTSVTLEVGQSDTLVATVKPDNATNKNVSWTSSNSGVVTVNNGEIKAVGEGSAVITATADGKNVTCNVTVNKKVTYDISWEKIESSAVGQYKLYIVSSEGKKVGGKVKLIFVGGSSKEQEVTVDGYTAIKSAITGVEIISAK